MAKNSMIKWTRSDAMKLSYAVREFNRTIKELETEENKLYLPEPLNYKDVKEKIFTRNELNRQINSLNRFNRENEQRLVKTDMGELLTKWEYKELKKEKRRAEKRLTRDLIEEKEKNAGLRAGFRTQREKELEENIKSLNKLFTSKGYDFKKIKNRLHRIGIGISDYDYYKADIYRQNFYTALKDIKSFKNYKILKEKLDSINNPIKFFEYIQQSDTLSDLFLYYKEGDGLVYGSYASNEDAFNKALEELGLIKE